MSILNYVGSISLSNSGNSAIEYTRCNFELIFSPVYENFNNILYNNLSVLKGHKVTANLELLFIADDITDTTKYHNALVMINELKGSLNRPITVTLNNTTQAFSFDTQTNDINYKDVLSNNQRVGYKLTLKLEKDILVPPNGMYNSWTEILPVNSNILSDDILIENFYCG